ncbi:MAG: dihydrofolate reductase family protein [Candidatus Woykebacteria bacterium]
MIYQDKDLPKGSSHNPFIYTNFVTTVDGKVQVLENWRSYWPIGSKTDYQTLLELRSFSDCLIHGSSTAKTFNFSKTINTQSLRDLRKKLGKKETLPYVVLSNNPDKILVESLKSRNQEKTYLVTNNKAVVKEEVKSDVNLVRAGKEKIDLKDLVLFLAKNLGAKRILVEGGPSVLGSFLSQDLIDEVFITITPKIFGNFPGKALTMVEGTLFPADKVKHLKLISAKSKNDEVFLRYQIVKSK